MFGIKPCAPSTLAPLPPAVSGVAETGGWEKVSGQERRCSGRGEKKEKAYDGGKKKEWEADEVSKVRDWERRD